MGVSFISDRTPRHGSDRIIESEVLSKDIVVMKPLHANYGWRQKAIIAARQESGKKRDEQMRCKCLS